MIVTRTGKLWHDEETGLMWFEYAANSVVTLDDAKENVDAMLQVSAGTKHALICDISKCKSIDQKAREYFGGPRTRTEYIAMALLGGSPISNMFANFFIALYSRDGVPTRLFTSKADAIRWLKGFAK